jgi:cytochrome c biogenesis protein
MSVSTHGIRIHSRSHTARALVELLSSMRFAISLLSVICIASIIGTVLKQHEPFGNYVNQFGPFWAQVFDTASLYRVYSSWWFLLILTFLVVSTSLCIARSTPKILKDLRVYKENMRADSLRAFGLRASAEMAQTPEEAARRIGGQLTGGGWKVRLQQRHNTGGAESGWMVAAKKGSAGRLGYIAAHGAIVLVCLGGLLDGDLVVRAQMLLHGKTPYKGGGMIADVSPQHRLSPSNPTFRGNLLVTEGTQSGSAILNQADGILVQDLPFTVELKKFVVSYYSTGMPKLFASDIVIHDRATGATKTARVEVNHPASYDGVEIYQSSFDDGGSHVKLRAIPMQGDGAGRSAATPVDVEGTVGGSLPLTPAMDGGAGKQTLEFAALRTINVEDFGRPGSATGSSGGTDVRKVDLRAAIDARMGSPNKPSDEKALRNVGPSITYRIRDASGQAREFHNYMLPVDTGDGVPVFLLGSRSSEADTFRYLRLPADEKSSLDTFTHVREALADPRRRDAAVHRYALQAVDPARPTLASQLEQSAGRALALFAGDPSAQAPKGEKTAASAASPKAVGGLQAISDFMEANVPVAERPRAGEVLIRILNGVLFELVQETRKADGLAPLEPSEKTQAYMTQLVLSLSDVQQYPAAVAFELKDFKQVQASVFQVARAPGKIVVYLGCAFLILGVFAMLFVRERRLWIWLEPFSDRLADNDASSGGCRATMALSSNRKTLDGHREFSDLKARLIGAESAAPSSSPDAGFA